METFSALLAFSAGNSSAIGEFPAQRHVTRNFDVFFDLLLISSHRWFETPSRPLWHHCNVEYGRAGEIYYSNNKSYTFLQIYNLFYIQTDFLQNIQYHRYAFWKYAENDNWHAQVQGKLAQYHCCWCPCSLLFIAIQHTQGVEFIWSLIPKIN